MAQEAVLKAEKTGEEILDLASLKNKGTGSSTTNPSEDNDGGDDNGGGGTDNGGSSAGNGGGSTGSDGDTLE